MASRVRRQRSLRPEAGRRALARGPRRRGERRARGVQGRGRPRGAGRRPPRPPRRPGAGAAGPPGARRAAAGGPCRRRQAGQRRAAGGDRRLHRPAGRAGGRARHPRARRGTGRRHAAVGPPATRRPAPAHHADRPDRRHLRRYGIRGRRRARARSGVAELRRAQHRPRPPGAHDDGHLLRRARGLRAGAPHAHQPRAGTDDALAHAADLRRRPGPRLPHRRAGRDAHPRLPPGRGAGRRPRPDDGAPARHARPPGPDPVRRRGAHPLAAVVLPLHRAVGRVRRVVPRAPRRPALGRVGWLRHGQPACADRQRHRPGGVLRVRLRHGHRARPDVPLGHQRHARHGRGRRPVHEGLWSGAVRVPVGWLAQYVDVPAGTTVEDLDTAFVRLGLEVEEIHRPEPVTGPLVIGRVLGIEELTGFKKPIRYCQVDVGEAGPRGIVCGARNFAVGDAVIVALPGAVLPGGFEITARTTYDRVSDGMICSVRELGVGDDHAGILVLGSGREGVPRPGTPAGPVVGLDDVVIELAVTPDRGYCLAMRGIAREMGTGLAAPWRDPGAVPPPAWSGEPAWEVTVADPERCDRFSMIAMEGLDPTAPSPWWMRRRLAQAAVRSISLAVDVTNYVMLELGQPMHAFDRDAVTGPITVRLAREGEKLTTLDGAKRVLTGDDLLITDETGPIGLAAVMGGENTEIGDGSTAVLLEAAHWEPTGVSRTARRHRLPSEAAKRFERGTDPEMTVAALARAAGLLAEHGGARVVGGLVDVDTRRPRPAIPLDAGLPGRVAGIDYDPRRVVELLDAVGCRMTADGEVLDVVPPSWRPDLALPADLVEEVVRLAGFDDIPSVLPTAPPGRGLTEIQRRRRSIGRALADAGYVEAPAYPFVGTAALDALGLDGDDPRRAVVVVRNPLSEEEPALRTTLLPGLLATLARNLARGQRDVALFEHGAVFLGGVRGAAPVPGIERRPDDETLAAILGAVPEQPWHVAAALAGNREPRGWWGPGRPAVWADAVQAARLVAAAAGVELTVRAGELAPWHPGRCAELLVGDGAGARVVGHAGELHPRVCAALELPPRTSVMELDVDALPAAGVPVGPHVSTFPPVLLDLALVVADDVPAAEVEASVRSGAGELLEDLRLFDVYTGTPIPAGHRSLAYALTLRAPDRTLTGEEATAVRDAAVAAAAERTGARLRA